MTLNLNYTRRKVFRLLIFEILLFIHFDQRTRVKWNN